MPKLKLVRKLWNGVQTQSPKPDIDPRSASDTITQVSADTDPRIADTITEVSADTDPRFADTITQA